jgi:hypothetical protein
MLLIVAALVVVAEAAVVIVLAVLDVLDLSGDRLGLGIGVGLILAAYGFGQLWAAWRVVHGDAWARSPLIVTQLIQLLLSWELRRGAGDVPGIPSWLSVLMALTAATVLVCLLAPPVTRALRDDETV